MTFISRILGLIRDFIIARLFGANELTDAFLVAFRIPNFFRRLFAEGAFSQAFLPILAETKANENDIEVQLVINHIATKLLSVLMIITLIAVIAAPLVIFIFAWGFYFPESIASYQEASRLDPDHPMPIGAWLMLWVQILIQGMQECQMTPKGRD